MTEQRDLVNLAGLASRLGKSLPTLRGLIADNADFPLIHRGSRGRDYVIDAGAAEAWLRRHEERRYALIAEKRERLASERASIKRALDAEFGER